LHASSPAPSAIAIDLRRRHGGRAHSKYLEQAVEWAWVGPVIGIALQAAVAAFVILSHHPL
jgi:hypothetical protein